jgi:hypothetical protein
MNYAKEPAFTWFAVWCPLRSGLLSLGTIDWAA